MRTKSLFRNFTKEPKEKAPSTHTPKTIWGEGGKNTTYTP